MPGFSCPNSATAGLTLWRADPDDDGAHVTILGWLRAAVTSGTFLPPDRDASNPLKGNLGEFIAYRIGQEYAFTNVLLSDTANAWDPLSEIARPGIDIVWLHFATREEDDWAGIQEVKTTGAASLALADKLLEDYDKLFGRNVRFTLRTRLDALKNKLDAMGHRTLSPRLTRLGGPDPAQAKGLQLFPTLVHESRNDATSKLTVVRQALLGRGWSTESVTCWSISVRDLDNRLTRLARGTP